MQDFFFFYIYKRVLKKVIQVLTLFAITCLLVALGYLSYQYRVYLYSWFIEFPKPIYPYEVQENTYVSMHDGIQLATDIYLPKISKKSPVIILRTPYDKSGSFHPYKQIALLFASQGYVFIVQDVRGKYRSQGEFDPYHSEGVDGYWTVEWAGTQPWSNGHVALYGFSYLGSCAWLVTPYNSRYLKTIIPMFTTQDTYSIIIDNGMFHLKGALYWLTTFSGRYQTPKLTFDKIKKSLMKLPVSSLDQDVIGRPIKAYQDYVTHVVPDHFWAKICLNQRMNEINLPAFIITGWYDMHVQGAIDDFIRMSESPEHSMNRMTYLVIGPWAHNPSQKFEGFDYGRPADFNLQLVSTLKWCDYWLKGEPEALEGFSKVKYFMLGRNCWRESDQWPPRGVKQERYYLSALNNKKKRCIYNLSKNPPPISSETRFMYDPNQPVPFRGSHHLHDPSWVGPFEQGELLCRNDVITYMSEPLKEDIEIAGMVKLVLYVSSNVIDTDFCAKICDMRPTGESYNLQAGFVRMRYRESLHMPTYIEPGKIYRLEISLRSIAHAFLKGHRIQLQIASSDFPVHDRNLNTGENCEFSTEVKVAEQTIYTGGAHLSHLILPVLSSESLEK